MNQKDEERMWRERDAERDFTEINLQKIKNDYIKGYKDGYSDGYMKCMDLCVCCFAKQYPELNIIEFGRCKYCGKDY
ncbi:MAG: hypothetical protein ACE5GV_12465 [Candidatus Scalindua sp.]